MDLAGNVWEWCWNAFDDPDDLTFPQTSQNTRVLRGGCWRSSPNALRCTIRNWYDPGLRLDYFGFRVVCSSHLP